jgi:hypothetical protein
MLFDHDGFKLENTLYVRRNSGLACRGSIVVVLYGQGAKQLVRWQRNQLELAIGPTGVRRNP